MQVVVTQIDEDGELIDTPLELIHASRCSHVGEHADWIKQLTRIPINSGVGLWEQRGELFPNLEFCESVADRIQELKPGNPMLQQVMKRLRELQDYCQTWKTGYFDSTCFPCKTTNESQTRLQELKTELTFDCPDGKKRICGWHMRMTPDAWRLHFSPEVGPGKLVICYIGPKIQ